MSAGRSLPGVCWGQVAIRNPAVRNRFIPKGQILVMKNRKIWIRLALIYIFAQILSLAISYNNMWTGAFLQEHGRKYLVLIILVSAIISAIYLLILEKSSFKTVYSLAIVWLLPALFSFVSIWKNSWRINGEKNGIYILYAFLLFFNLSVFYCIASWIISSKEKKAALWSSLALWFKKNFWIIGVLLIVIVSRLPYLNSLPLWDAGEYFEDLSEGLNYFRYDSFKSIIECFSICNHPSLFFALVYIIGQMIVENSLFMVGITTLIVTCIAICAFYSLVKKMARVSEFKAAFITLIMSFTPVFFGTFGYFGVDYFLGCAFVLLIWACVFDHPILCGLFALACFQSKETGIVIVAALVLGMIINTLLKNKGFDKIRALYRDARLWAILLSTIVQLAYYAYVGMGKWSDGFVTEGSFWDGTGYNTWSFKPSYILLKIEQLYLLNFNWIISAAIIIAAIILLVRYFKGRKGKSNQVAEIRGNQDISVIPLVTAIIGYFLFSALYVTASLPRYNVLNDFMLVLLATVLVRRVLRKSAFKKKENYRRANVISACMTAGIGVLMGVECFITIDPVSKCMFTNLTTGSQTILYTEKQFVYLTDALIYNTQYQYINAAVDKILAEVDYSPSKMNIAVDYFFGSQTCGNSDAYVYNWDNLNKKRTFKNTDYTESMRDNDISCRNITWNEETASYQCGGIDLMENAVYIIDPRFFTESNTKEVMIERAEQFYDLGEEEVVEVFGGKLYYYRASLKS